MLRKLLTALLLCAAFGGQATLAAPLTYDESVSGDINGNTFVLDVGINTISGAMRLVTFVNSEGATERVEIDFDPFFFYLRGE